MWINRKQKRAAGYARCHPAGVPFIFALRPKIDPSPSRDEGRCGCEISRSPPRKPQLTAESSCRARRGPGPPSPPGTHGSSAAPAPTCPAPLPGAPPVAAPRPGQPQGTVRPRCGRGVRRARAKGEVRGWRGGVRPSVPDSSLEEEEEALQLRREEGMGAEEGGRGVGAHGEVGGELSQRQQVFQGDRCPQLHARGSPVAIAGSGRLGIGDGGRDAGTGRGGGGGGRKRRGWQKDETYVLRPLPSAEPQLRRLAAVPPPNSCSGRGEPKSKAPPRKKITMQSGTAHGKDLFLSPDIAPPAAHPQKESKTVPTSPPNTYTPNTFQPFASLTAGNGPAAHRGAPQPAWSSPGPPSAAGGAPGAQPPPAAAASSCRQGPY